VTIAQTIGQVAPFYNLLIAVVVFLFFVKLFQVSKKPRFVKPWKLLFTAFMLYVVEQVLSILRLQGIFYTPRILNSLFELVIIVLFIYFILAEHHRCTKNRWTIVHTPKKHNTLFKFRGVIDKGIYFIAVFSPAMTLPQVYKIWIEHTAAGVSVVSWGSYLAAAIFWLTYGILHRVKPIIIANSCWVVLEVFIVVGVIMYG